MKWYAWVLLILAVLFGAIPGLIAAVKYVKAKIAAAKAQG